MLANLLDNALRYTQEGGQVTLALASHAAEVVLTVDDSGPGIAPELREKVFERFFRASPDTEGTGLGLAIVQEAARAFGAHLLLQDRPDGARGLRVRVVFAGL